MPSTWSAPVLFFVMAASPSFLQEPEAPAAPPAHVLIRQANDLLESAVAARPAGDAARATAAIEEARRLSLLLAEAHSLPFTLRRLETAEAWSEEESRRAAGAWSVLRRAESDLVRARIADLQGVLEDCRALRDRWCEGRTLAALAESQAQSSLPPEVRDAATAAEAILREAGPSASLARALLLMRGSGTEGGAAAAAKARERYAEAVSLARLAGEASIEGRVLCETVRLDLTAGRNEAARAGLDEIAALAKSSGDPRAAACGAYFEGLSAYFARDPKRARAAWDAFAASGLAAEAPREMVWILVGAAAASIDLVDGEGAVSRMRRAISIARTLNGDADLLPAQCNLATGLFEMGRPGDLAEPARACVDLGRKHGRRDAEAVGLRRMGNAAAARGDPRGAERLFSEGLALSREIKNLREAGWALASLADLVMDLGRVAEARRHLEESIALADQTGETLLRSYARAALARALVLAGDADRAEAAAGEALRLAGDSGPAASRGFSHRVRGMVRERRHDYEGALDEYRLALDLFETAGNRSVQANVANDIGNVQFWLNRHDLALESYQSALRIAREAGVFEPQAVAINNIELLKRRSRGITEEDRAFLTRMSLEASRMRPAPNQAINLMNLARVLLALNEPGEAESVARRAAALAGGVGTAGLGAEARRVLAQVLSGRGKHEEAVAECREVLAAPGGADPQMRMMAFATCGAVLLRAGRPAEAVPVLETSVGLADAARGRLTQAALKASYLEDKWEIYLNLVDALLSRAGAEPAPEAVAEAFRVSEMYKARGLLESIAAEKANEGPATPLEGAAVPPERHAVLARMAELHLASAGASGEAAAGLMAEIRRLEERWEQVTPAPERRAGPALLGAAPAPLEAIQAALPDERTALVSYQAGWEKGFVFVVTRHDARAYALKGGREEAEPLLRYRGLLERRGADPGRDAEAIRLLGERLYRSLLAPARGALAGIERLIVCPDGLLNFLPIEALVVPAEEGRPARFLVEEFEVTVAPSATVLLELAARPGPRRGGRRLLAFADPAAGPAPPGFPSPAAEASRSGGASPPRLRFAEEEVRLAAERIGEGAAVRTGADVTEARVRRALGAGYDVVHVASHGFLDPGSTGRSGLLLTPEPDAGDDGLLQAREVVDLRVAAGLIVLSGCSTGGGRLVPGEGLMGLPHALFQAGARSLLMSLWGIRDRAAAIFMDRFYAALARGARYGEAAREAKLGLLRSGRADLAHPSVWAPFVLAGVHDGRIDAEAAPGRGPLLVPALGIAALAAAAAAAAGALAVIGVRAARRRGWTASR